MDGIERNPPTDQTVSVVRRGQDEAYLGGVL